MKKLMKLNVNEIAAVSGGSKKDLWFIKTFAVAHILLHIYCPEIATPKNTLITALLITIIDRKRA